MKTENILMIGLVILVVVGLSVAFIVTTKNKDISNTDTLRDQTSSYVAKMTGTTEIGDVAIELKPHNIVSGELSVDFAMNTHSVDMTSFDLKKMVSLEYDGKSIPPNSAPELRGHHNSGTLTFNVDKNINAFKIIIKGIPSVEKRVYQW